MTMRYINLYYITLHYITLGIKHELMDVYDTFWRLLRPQISMAMAEALIRAEFYPFHSLSPEVMKYPEGQPGGIIVSVLLRLVILTIEPVIS